MKRFTFLILTIFFSITSFTQEKRPLTFDDILKWNRITETKISNDGNTIAYKYEPWKGNPGVFILNKNGEKLNHTPCGTNIQITNDSKFVVFTVLPDENTIRELKLKDVKKEQFPQKKLAIYDIEQNQLDTLSNLENYKVPGEWSGWILYQLKPQQKDDGQEIDSTERKKESEENGYSLSVKNLHSGEIKVFPFVHDYTIAEENESIAFYSSGDNKAFKAGVYFYDLKNDQLISILATENEIKQLSIKKDGKAIGFLANTSKESKNYSLYLWLGEGAAEQVVTNSSENIPVNLEISENGRIQFAEKKDRLFFGLAPVKPEKDTSVLEEEIPVVDVWRWNDPVLYTEQLNTLKQDLKETYLTVYHINKDKVVQLEKEKYTGIQLINKGNHNKVLAWSNLPYSIQVMWEGSPVHNDFYFIDINTGESKMIKKDCRATPMVSPGGKYLYWYEALDTTWNTYDLNSGQEYEITTPGTLQCANELNDIPNPAWPYGIAGWTLEDNSILVYDRFDVWKVDPQNKNQPVNITKNGRLKGISYRVVDFNNQNRWQPEEGIDTDEPLFLRGHNEITRADGYYQLSLKKQQMPEELISGKYQLNQPVKAKDEQTFVYTRETFEEFPNLWITNNNFRSSKQISNVNPQQEEYLWGTIELFTWTSLDGRELQGLVAKPANFDPNKKYPMIVNFYEKSSQGLYDHRIPEAHRSTVDYHYYTSNGYIVFNPDVYYKTGYPGEDAFNCVMSGVTNLIDEGYVDKDHIAAQGHSWGGYQVAYLATRTNLFAAIESGAPVVNMFSAYGGIRLWSGRNRSFQYEHTQSRIGKSIWKAPLRYLENSPLFTADKINTPLLIMHNDKDGAVPVSQGVEFYIALRRLEKPAWLLNYNEGDHWPTKVRDKYDFQIRLAQFFDHYLKGEPMPVWMKEGIPATKKGVELGYELTE